MLVSRAVLSLLYQLALRDFKQRYVGSVLGWLWGVIHPLVLLAVYTFLFRYAFEARLPPDEVTESYPLFLLAGILPWLLFSETLMRSATALTEHSALIKKSVFPAEALPMSILASTGLAHLVALAVLGVVAALWGHFPTTSLAQLPVYVVSLAVFSLGLAWIVAGFQVYLRDTAQVLSVAMTAWFWATPIFLPEAFYRGKLDVALEWNPLRYVVMGYRAAILGGQPLDLADLGKLGVFSLVAFAMGALFFRRAKRGFADVM